MPTIELERVEQVASSIFFIKIDRRSKNNAQLQRERDLDDTFNTEEASSMVYHRTNGQTITSLRGWLREDYFESEPGSEAKFGDDAVFMRVPTHRFYFVVGSQDWIECEGLMYNVILAKKSIGGTTTLLLHKR